LSKLYYEQLFDASPFSTYFFAGRTGADMDADTGAGGS
jgi:hypothetical protein